MSFSCLLICVIIEKNMQAFFRNSLEIPAFVFKILPIEYSQEKDKGL